MDRLVRMGVSGIITDRPACSGPGSAFSVPVTRPPSRPRRNPRYPLELTGALHPILASGYACHLGHGPKPGRGDGLTALLAEPVLTRAAARAPRRACWPAPPRGSGCKAHLAVFVQTDTSTSSAAGIVPRRPELLQDDRPAQLADSITYDSAPYSKRCLISSMVSPSWATERASRRPVEFFDAIHVPLIPAQTGAEAQYSQTRFRRCVRSHGKMSIEERGKNDTGCQFWSWLSRPESSRPRTRRASRAA